MSKVDRAIVIYVLAKEIICDGNTSPQKLICCIYEHFKKKDQTNKHAWLSNDL